jgi:hypothetical protein
MLHPAGFVLMDDIDRSDSFWSFVDEIGSDHQSLIVSADDGRALIGIIQKPPTECSEGRLDARLARGFCGELSSQG